jgi:hypothetical protein
MLVGNSVSQEAGAIRECNASPERESDDMAVKTGLR